MCLRNQAIHSTMPMLNVLIEQHDMSAWLSSYFEILTMFRTVQPHGSTFIITNDLIRQLMVDHLILNNNKGLEISTY